MKQSSLVFSDEFFSRLRRFNLAHDSITYSTDENKLFLQSTFLSGKLPATFRSAEIISVLSMYLRLKAIRSFNESKGEGGY